MALITFKVSQNFKKRLFQKLESEDLDREPASTRTQAHLSDLRPIIMLCEFALEMTFEMVALQYSTIFAANPP